MDERFGKKGINERKRGIGKENGENTEQRTFYVCVHNACMTLSKYR